MSDSDSSEDLSVFAAVAVTAESLQTSREKSQQTIKRRRAKALQKEGGTNSDEEQVLSLFQTQLGEALNKKLDGTLYFESPNGTACQPSKDNAAADSSTNNSVHSSIRLFKKVKPYSPFAATLVNRAGSQRPPQGVHSSSEESSDDEELARLKTVVVEGRALQQLRQAAVRQTQQKEDGSCAEMHPPEAQDGTGERQGLASGADGVHGKDVKDSRKHEKKLKKQRGGSRGLDQVDANDGKLGKKTKQKTEKESTRNENGKKEQERERVVSLADYPIEHHYMDSAPNVASGDGKGKKSDRGEKREKKKKLRTKDADEMPFRRKKRDKLSML